MTALPFTAALSSLALVAALGLAGCDRAVAPASAAPAADATVATAEAEAEAPAPGALCAHGVPADLCTRCEPALAEVFKAQGDWCEAHGLPESHCTACNPGLTFAAAPAVPAGWCRDHAIPESMCTKCSPTLVATFIQAGDYCREHGFPASACPRCHPERVRAAGMEPPRFPPEGTIVRLATLAAVRGAGIETRPAEARRLARTLEVVGALEYDRNRLAQLSARGEALVVDVRVDVGDDVKAGQPLVLLASAAVGGSQAQRTAAAARVQAARAAVAREEGLVARGVSPRKDLEDARRELAEAEAELEAAGAALSAAGGAGGAGGRYALTAPFAGTVVARNAVAGRTAGSGEVLVEVADLRTMWAWLEIPEQDAVVVRPGQKVTLVLDALPEAPIEATVDRVGTSVDPAGRTVRARVAVPNRERSLRAGMFLRARVQVSAEHGAVVVPQEAVQRAEGQPIVFVQESERAFRPVPVELGARAGGEVEVRGIEAGAAVVTAGAFLLKTEIMKDSIGAGCCDHERPR